VSHNAQHVIIDANIPALQNADVREHWTTDQCAKVDAICARAPNWTDEQYRYVQRRLAQAFCQED
jgi:hypothetical protein